MACELCGGYPHDLHHCLMGNTRRKGTTKASRDWLNDPMNLQILCRPCHKRVQALYSNRVLFFEKQYAEHKQVFLEWAKNPPTRIKNGYAYRELEIMLKGIDK